MAITVVTDNETQLQQLLGEAIATLRYCNGIFNEYADKHTEKGKTDKAKANRQIACTLAGKIVYLETARTHL